VVGGGCRWWCVCVCVVVAAAAAAVVCVEGGGVTSPSWISPRECRITWSRSRQGRRCAGCGSWDPQPGRQRSCSNGSRVFLSVSNCREKALSRNIWLPACVFPTAKRKLCATTALRPLEIIHLPLPFDFGQDLSDHPRHSLHHIHIVALLSTFCSFLCSA